MKHIFLIIFILITLQPFAQTGAQIKKIGLMVAPGTLGANAVTLLWDKQPGVTTYTVFLNGKNRGSSTKTNITVENLKPSTQYSAVLYTHSKNKKRKSSSLNFKTPATGKIFNIIDFGAKTNPGFMNTKAIQSAINACTDGGIVYIPKGTFVSGALYLKSNMTLFIEQGAVLQGSDNPVEYLPMIKNRFEGWEMDTYASLLNAGKLSRDGLCNVKNLRINGGGTIRGGGKKLGDAQRAANGIRNRGRLILLMNCRDVSISNLTITDPPAWTIHYIYSNNITCSNLHIITKGIHNGDGIDPDSSTDSYIFNCTFDTGDDCIAIKSGKNPEGFYVAKPTKNVRVTDCNFVNGHGISIGSEMSGGVSDVLVQDCKAGKLLHGMQIKATRDRGGYVRNVVVEDCQLLKITIFSTVNYNNDGTPAPLPPIFENFVFRNIDLSAASTKEPVININGFKDPGHLLTNVLFQNILLPKDARVEINDAKNILFKNVKTMNVDHPQIDKQNAIDILVL